MIPSLLLASVALADGAPNRLVTFSSEYDAVVLVEPAADGAERHLTVLLADHATSAPVTEAQVRLALRGPQSLDVDATSHGIPGHYDVDVALTGEGPWEGGVTILTNDRADVVGLPSFMADDHDHEAAHEHEEEAHDHGPAAWTWGAVGVGGLALGWWLGRRRAVPAVMLLTITASRAHDGEDHGVLPAPTLTADGGVPLGLDRQFLLGLRTAVAHTTEARPTTRVLGEVIAAPGFGAQVLAPAAGTLTGPVLSIGASVGAGDVLGRIEPAGPERATLLTAVTDAEARVTAAREALQLADADLRRAEGLEGALAAADRELRVSRVATARADLDAAESALTAAQAARRGNLPSPLSGTIAAWLAQPGDTLQPGTPVARVLADGDRQVRLSVPEHAATGLRAGDPLTFVLAADPTTPLAGTVLDPGVTVDPSTGHRAVTAAVTTASALRPGAAVRAWVPDGPPHAGLVIPESALLHGVGEPFVIVKTGPETFALRPVVPGARLGQDRAIRSGLQPGERVVTSASAPLRALLGR